MKHICDRNLNLIIFQFIHFQKGLSFLFQTKNVPRIFQINIKISFGGWIFLPTGNKFAYVLYTTY